MRMRRPEPEPEPDEDEEADADIETLYFGDIIPMEARENVQRPHDSYRERVRKREFGLYMRLMKPYWSVRGFTGTHPAFSKCRAIRIFNCLKVIWRLCIWFEARQIIFVDVVESVV